MIRLANVVFEQLYFLLKVPVLLHVPVVSHLPPSIVSLSLNLPIKKGGATQLLRGLAANRKLVPKLKEIVFEDGDDLDGETEKACNTVGVSIRHSSKDRSSTMMCYKGWER